jgi:hypothetical protein
MAPTQLEVAVMILLHPFAREGQRQKKRERVAERDTRRIAIAAFLLSEPYAPLVDPADSRAGKFSPQM